MHAVDKQIVEMDAQSVLFAEEISAAGSGVPTEPVASPSAPEATKPAPRLRLLQRFQSELRCESLDQRIEENHPVRDVWAFVEKVDMTSLLERIKAVQGRMGRNANNPRILLALWLYASIEGVNSARKLDRLCREHRAFEWICGGVSVNYHTLSDFRVQHLDFLTPLFAQSIAALTQEGLVDVNLVAQDGMRIRASAGSDTFRREGKLEEHLQQAEEHLAKLKAELDVNPNLLDARRKAAQERAASEKVDRIAKAIEHAQEIAANREKRKAGNGESARASTTDPEARRMKMPDGGTRPAYNAQFGTDVKSGIIVGVDATNAGNDARELEPMLETIQDNAGKVPEGMLADGSFSSKANVELAAEAGTVLYAPLREEQKQLDQGKDPYAAKKGDTPAMEAFRSRMGEPESKTLYKLRGQSAEWTNANARRHGLYQLQVRGLKKVKAVLLIFALAQNLLRAQAIRAERQKQA
jgi:transposase